MHCGIIWKTDNTYHSENEYAVIRGSETSVQMSLVEIQFFNYQQERLCALARMEYELCMCPR